MVPGTPEDSQVDPADDTLFNEAWADMAEGGDNSIPPPVEPDAPGSGRGPEKYTATPEEPDHTDPGPGSISAMSSNPYERIGGWRNAAHSMNESRSPRWKRGDLD